MSTLKFADLKLTQDVRTLGGHQTVYRIEHFPLVSVPAFGRIDFVEGTKGTLVGFAAKQGDQWVILFADGELAGVYATLREGAWNLVH